MVYFFTKIPNKNLIKITRNKTTLYLRMSTNIKKAIYIYDKKHYIDVEIDECIHDMINEIKSHTNRYIEKEISMKLKFNEKNITENIMTLKLPRRYDRYQVQFQYNDGTLCTSSTIQTNMNVNVDIQLDYIWYNEVNWGFDFKINNIIINNVGK